MAELKDRTKMMGKTSTRERSSWTKNGTYL